MRITDEAARHVLNSRPSDLAREAGYATLEELCDDLVVGQQTFINWCRSRPRLVVAIVAGAKATRGGKDD